LLNGKCHTAVSDFLSRWRGLYRRQKHGLYARRNQQNGRRSANSFAMHDFAPSQVVTRNGSGLVAREARQPSIRDDCDGDAGHPYSSGFMRKNLVTTTKHLA
jgi:hypothetical protein